MFNFYYTIDKALIMIYAESSIKNIEYNFNFKDENNVFTVNNQPISDELEPLPGNSTEVTEHAKSHRNKTKLVDILSEDYALVLTTGITALTIAGILTGVLLVPIVPSLTYFDVSYSENIAILDFQLLNVYNGETILSIVNNNTEEVIYEKTDLANSTYSLKVELEYNVTYDGKIVNMIDGVNTVVKQFELLISK